MNTALTTHWPADFAERMFYLIAYLIILTSAVFLFYYAWLIPVHVDEAGYWFNFTNKSFANRFVPNQQFPNHSLTIYASKISLSLFGHNGIGLRFPVIFFGILSWAVFYAWIKALSRSTPLALGAVCLLCLNPFYQHYSHELRGYPSYFFFIVCIYWILSKLEHAPLTLRHWIALWILFIACYLSNLASPLFYVLLLSSLWILFAQRYFKIEESRWQGIRYLRGKPFFMFCTVALGTILAIVYFIDHDVIFRSMSRHAGFATNWIAIPDFFSTFLGYQYLDDPRSELARYPLLVWVVFLVAFLYGWLTLLRQNHFFAQLFSLLILGAALFYGFGGRQAPLRSSIFLLPLIVGLQSYGFWRLSEALEKISGIAFSANKRYLTLSSLLLLCLIVLHTQKLSRLDFNHGNAYEQARKFLSATIEENALIISSLQDTVGGFYFGEMIRQQTRSIFHSGKLSSVYFISKSDRPSTIALSPTVDMAHKADVIALDAFEKIASFQNNGERPSAVHIFKKYVATEAMLKLGPDQLANQEYFGSQGKQCSKGNEGLRLTCADDGFACVHQIYPDTVQGKGQFVIFHHLNDRGVRAVSFSALKGAEQHPQTGALGLGYAFFSGIYLVNPLIDNIDDLDTFRENVDLYDLSYQRIQSSQNGLLLCMTGKLFTGNSKFLGISVLPVPF
jgi:hypothetical protein